MPTPKDDILEVEILEDGTIKVTSDKVSAANHMAADQMLTFLARLTGGETTITKRTKTVHSHSHEKAKESA